MALLDPPRCPQCNAYVSLAILWSVAPKQNRGTSLSGSVGIACPVCGAKLKVLQARAQLSYFLSFVLLIAISMLVNRVIPLDSGTVSAKATWIVLAAVYFGGFALQQRSIPRLLQLRMLRDDEDVNYPLATLAKELETEAQHAREQLELESPDVGKPGWICTYCRQENPGNFDICWKCQTVRADEV
jgi:hypothetical protein